MFDQLGAQVSNLESQEGPSQHPPNLKIKGVQKKQPIEQEDEDMISAGDIAECLSDNDFDDNGINDFQEDVIVD